MAADQQSTSSLRALSVGDIVSVGVQVCRAYPKLFFRTALVAWLWILVPIYGWAKYSALCALISRLTYDRLTSQPESLKSTRESIDHDLWNFFTVGLLVSLLFGACAIAALVGVVLLAGIFAGIGAVAFQNSLADITNNWALALFLLVVLPLLVLMLIAALFAWLVGRFFIPEVVLAVEPSVDPVKAIGRSWRLTQGVPIALRLQGLFLIFLLVTLPVNVVVQLLPVAALLVGEWLSLEPTSVSVISTVINLVLFFGLSALITMLWQAVKAVLYYDVRSRQEGLDLSLSNKVVLADRFFNRVRLQTPESVELEFTLAGIGNRALALVTDYLILGLVLSVLLILLSIFAEQLFNLLEFWLGSENLDSLGQWLLAIALLLLYSVYTGYFVFFETLWQGQTPGKRLLRLRVIRDNGRRVGLGQSALRSLMRPVDDLFLVGSLLVALGKREKRIGDWVAGTVVIQEDRPLTATNFVVSPEGEGLVEQVMSLGDVSRLSPDEFAVVRSYLQRRQSLLPPARSQLNLELARSIKETIALGELPQRVRPDVFLEAVYLAYQRQGSRGR